MSYVIPALSLLGFAVVCFVIGACVVEYKSPLYRSVLQPSFRGLRALDEQRKWEQTNLRFGWYPARNQRTGVTKYKPELASNGLTLYSTSGESTTARLVSMTGEVVHQWHLPFREAWPEAPHVEDPVEEGRIHWQTVRMFPNGDLLADYGAIAAKPYGYGLVKMNKDSKVVWRYSDNAHHNFDVGPDGKIYGLRHSYVDRKIAVARHLRTPMLEDSVIVLSPGGEELQRIKVLDAFAKSKFKNYLDSIQSSRLGDHTHCNAIDVISPAFAQKHDFCMAGDVMLSLRNPSLLAILNLERQEIVWASHGSWKRQHDSDPLENGNIMVFDNQGNCGAGGTSRILEWNPINGAIEWCYRGTRTRPFESDSRGTQQLLSNCNVLVTEANRGRIFEVTRDGEIVWEYYNPDRPGQNHELVAVACCAVRYNPKQLTFLDEHQLAQISRNSQRH